MRKCSEPERAPLCCYLAFAYAAAPANLTCMYVRCSIRPYTSALFSDTWKGAESFSRTKVAAAHAVIT